jgi:hypothetical protein
VAAYEWDSFAKLGGGAISRNINTVDRGKLGSVYTYSLIATETMGISSA